MATTQISCRIKAPRSAVYRALLDPQMVQQWRVPDGITSKVHLFEPVEGGRVRVSLTYVDRTRSGKSEPQTDTCHRRFIKLIPDEQVVEVDEFETADPALQGDMTSTIRLVEMDGDTRLDAIHEGLPRGLSPTDNELGWKLALKKLARLVEDDQRA